MKKIFFFGLIVIVFSALYYPVLFTYFSQDDFFHFKASLRFTNLFQMFGFYPFAERGIAFYRPLFREVLFSSFFNLFGLNVLPFRILQVLLLLLNSVLGFIFVKKVFTDYKIALFVSIFYAVCSAQVSPLYYLAGGIQVIGATTFLLLTLILTVKYLETSKIKYLILSYIIFILALASHELTSILPFLISSLLFIYMPYKKALKQLWQFLPFFLLLFVYLYLEITKIGFSSTEQQYRTVLSIKGILNSYMWYTGWALGLPEMLIDFVNPGFKLNPVLMRYWGNYYSVIFPAFFISATLLILKAFSPAVFRTGFPHRMWEGKVDKKLLFFVFWYLISLSPVILLPLHKSTQYLETGLVAFWAIIGYIIFSPSAGSSRFDPPSREAGFPRRMWEGKSAYVYSAILMGALFTLSAASILLERTTYPAAQRGVIAEKLIKQITDKYPTLPKGAIVYIENDPNYPFIANEWGSSSKQAAFILNNEDALQLIYKDPTLKVYYQDLGGLPREAGKGRVYQLTAKIFN